MSQFTIYKSSDASAITMSGQSGSLLSVLDSVLVNGYGSKPGAGWTKPFPNTSSVGCYRLGTGSMLYLSVDDSAVATAKEARITGYDLLTSINTGTNPFPTSSQGVGGVAMVVARKSATIDTASRSWIIAADSRSCYVFVQTGDLANTYLAFFFGDFYTFASPDTANCMIVGRTTENSALMTADNLDRFSNVNTSDAGHFVAHTIGGGGTSITVGKHGDNAKANNGTGSQGSLPYPNTADTGVYISPVWISENATSAIRGTMRGFYHFCHSPSGVSDGQQFTGSGTYAGKSFQVVKSSANSCVYFLETSNTLDTN